MCIHVLSPSCFQLYHWDSHVWEIEPWSLFLFNDVSKICKFEENKKDCKSSIVLQKPQDDSDDDEEEEEDISDDDSDDDNVKGFTDENNEWLKPKSKVNELLVGFVCCCIQIICRYHK